MTIEQETRLIAAPITKSAIEAVKFNRRLKEESAGVDVPTGGNYSMDLRQILSTTFSITSRLEIEESEWLQAQREKLENYLQSGGVQQHEVRDAFLQGVERHIKRRYRFLRKNGQTTTSLESEDHLEGMIRGYTIDFFSSLSNSQRNRFPAGRAIEIAKKSYIFDPKLPDQLRKSYPDLEQWIILRALHGGVNPREFLDGVKKRIAKLSLDFPGFNKGIVAYAAVNQIAQGNEFLENLCTKLPKLISKYPQISQHELTVILLRHPKDPEQKIEDINRKTAIFQEMFPQFYPSTVRDIVLRHSNPQDFLTQASQRLTSLQARFSDAPTDILLHAVVKCPHNSSEFAQEAMRLVNQLRRELPDISLTSIIRMVINKKSKEEKNGTDQEELDELSA